MVPNTPLGHPLRLHPASYPCRTGGRDRSGGFALFLPLKGTATLIILTRSVLALGCAPLRLAVMPLTQLKAHMCVGSEYWSTLFKRIYRLFPVQCVVLLSNLAKFITPEKIRSQKNVTSNRKNLELTLWPN